MGDNTNITRYHPYTITLPGYPPEVQDTPRHLHETASQGVWSVEPEGIVNWLVHSIYERRETMIACLMSLSLEIPVFCTVRSGPGCTDEKMCREALGGIGCEMEFFLVEGAVFDNGPLIPYYFPNACRHNAGWLSNDY